MTMKLGVCTVSTPEYTPDEVLDECAAIGYDGVQWRVKKDTGDRNNPSFWSGNRAGMSAEEIIDRADDLKAKADALGLEMPALGTYLNVDAGDAIELSMKAARSIGATQLRVSPGGYKPERGSYPKQVAYARGKYAEVADLAAAHGVRALIETHMNQLAPSVTKAMNILRDLDPEFVGIIWDVGNQIAEGLEVYRMAIDQAGPYLAQLHVKNMRYERGEVIDGQQTWRAVSCPVREGIVDWPELISVLRDTGYDGWLFFEDFSTAVPVGERIRRNHDWLRGLLGGIS